VKKQIAKNFQRLGFDVDWSATDSELAAAVIELAVAESPDMSPTSVGLSGSLGGIHGLSPSSEFLESSVRT
jgi:hypothetical protein